MSKPPFLWHYSSNKTMMPSLKPYQYGDNDDDQIYSYVGNWLKDRDTLFTRYAELAFLLQQKSVEGSLVSEDEFFERLRSFFESLIDTLSSEELGLLEKMLRAEERQLPTPLGIDALILRQIQGTTDRLLDFNDKYDDLYSKGKGLEYLPGDLNQAGDDLVLREDLVNRLVKRYYAITNRPPHAQFEGHEVTPSHRPSPTAPSTSHEQSRRRPGLG